MNGLEEIIKFIKKYGINVTLEFLSEDDAYRIRFRDYEEDTALDVKFNGNLFEQSVDSAVKYAIEKAETEMIKHNKTVEELTND